DSSGEARSFRAFTCEETMTHDRSIEVIALAMLASLLSLGAPVPVAAKENADYQPDKVVALDPATAGADYAVQGEYEGSTAAGKLAAQVIALGGGQFRAVFERGGLPGDGWDGATRTEI